MHNLEGINQKLPHNLYNLHFVRNNCHSFISCPEEILIRQHSWTTTVIIKLTIRIACRSGLKLVNEQKINFINYIFLCVFKDGSTTTAVNCMYTWAESAPGQVWENSLHKDQGRGQLPWRCSIPTFHPPPANRLWRPLVLVLESLGAVPVFLSNRENTGVIPMLF